MKPKLKTFYCYQFGGKTKIEDKKPPGSAYIKHYLEVPAPNKAIAEQMYKTDLRINQWRK